MVELIKGKRSVSIVTFKGEVDTDDDFQFAIRSLVNKGRTGRQALHGGVLQQRMTNRKHSSEYSHRLAYYF